MYAETHQSRHLQNLPRWLEKCWFVSRQNWACDSSSRRYYCCSLCACSYDLCCKYFVIIVTAAYTFSAVRWTSLNYVVCLVHAQLLLLLFWLIFYHLCSRRPRSGAHQWPCHCWGVCRLIHFGRCCHCCCCCGRWFSLFVVGKRNEMH